MLHISSFILYLKLVIAFPELLLDITWNGIVRILGHGCGSDIVSGAIHKNKVREATLKGHL